MQNHGEVQRLIVVIILNIIILAFLIAVSNFTYAQKNLELHQNTLGYLPYENHTSSNAGIAVGYKPSAIDVNYNTHIVYVANRDDNTVSVIDGKNNTKIGDIPVGRYLNEVTDCCGHV